MRVMVTGSRDWSERSIIRMELARYVSPRFAEPTLVHGGAAGADSIAAEIADGLLWTIEAHPADWQRWGNAAGPIRNREMVESGVDLCLAFRLRQSIGTSGAIGMARGAGVPLVVWDCDGDYTRLTRTSEPAPTPRAEAER